MDKDFKMDNAERDRKLDEYVLPTPQMGEPWVGLPGAKELENWQHEDEVAYNQAQRQWEKARFFRLAFDFLKENSIPGDYFEFGCHRARTFRMALTEARRRNLMDMTFWAFDSFAGLPDVAGETNIRSWTPGSLKTDEQVFLKLISEHGLFMDQVKTVAGFYDQSLTPDLSAQMKRDGVKAKMVTVDCDFYESAVPVFRFFDQFLQEGSVLYIDDYFAGYGGSPNKGVARAFAEYQQTSTYKFVEHLSIGWWGKSYIAYL